MAGSEVLAMIQGLARLGLFDLPPVTGTDGVPEGESVYIQARFGRFAFSTSAYASADERLARSRSLIESFINDLRGGDDYIPPGYLLQFRRPDPRSCRYYDSEDRAPWILANEVDLRIVRDQIVLGPEYVGKLRRMTRPFTGVPLRIQQCVFVYWRPLYLHE